MYDYSKEVRSFHDKNISLTQAQSQDMQKRRDTNVQRIRDGLAELEKPGIKETISQGGNAMRTMTQPPEKDDETRYDIDEGIVFNEADAKTPKTTKGWVRDALAKKGSNFKEEPKSKPKCVRVVYADGYQCDFPVFQRHFDGTAWQYQIAINDEWVDSDPKSINQWFEKQVKDLSPEEDGDGLQLRRIVRMGKYFCKVHSHRTGKKFPAGLVSTALFVECYQPVAGRDDESFYETLKRVKNRSENLAVSANGIVISDEKDKDRIKRLREAAEDAITELDKLHDVDAKAEDARKAWKKTFRHSHFDEEGDSSSTNKSDADRLRRAEADAAALAAAGAGDKPWGGN